MHTPSIAGILADRARKGVPMTPDAPSLAELRNRVTLNPAEAAGLLGVVKSTLDELTGAARIPSFTLGGRRLVPVPDLIAWASAEAGRAADPIGVGDD